jgi:glycosyltransferase involved in cell wall biosynthesis
LSAVRPLRILMLADVRPDPNSGAAGTEMRLGDELEALGHDVTRGWADALPHRIRHWNLHHLLEQPRGYRAAIRRLSALHDFDVLHVNQPAGWLAAREHRRRGGRALFAHRSHGFEPRIGGVVRQWRKVYPEDRRSLWRRAASAALAPLLVRHYRAIAREAEAHAVSCTECADFLAGWGVARERIHVGAQAPPEEFLALPPAPWSAERARRILYVGQHSFVKAPMVVAAVLAELCARDPALEATWVAERSAHFAIRERLARAGASDRVRLLAWMSQRDLRELYDEHGLFLFPSFAEGFGKALVEAMARGLAVVATEQGGARDLIRAGANGLLAPVGDIAGLVAQARRLRAEPGLAESVGAAGRRTAERYTWRGAAAALAAFYGERLAAKGSRG